MATKENHIAVIGAGSWGTALALNAANIGYGVRLWAYENEVVEGINKYRRNPLYLTEFDLPQNINATSSMQEAASGAGVVFIVVPSHFMRSISEKLAHCVGPDAIIVCAAKGVENGTLMRMSEVAREVIKHNQELKFVTLSGPSFALEVARGYPTAVVAASRNPQWCETVQRDFSTGYFRIYTNDDVVGVELGGAVKNVVAIAAGVVRGLGLGHNTVAAIMTRGLAEIKRLVQSQGGRVETMAGLAGLGDLVLTCTGELSRNRRVGIELGRGRKLSEILEEMREIAEGVKTTRAIYELSQRFGVDMPITSSIYALLYEDKPARDAVSELMGRPLKPE